MLLYRRSIAAHESAGLPGFDTFSASEAGMQSAVLSLRLLITINQDNVRSRRTKRG